MVILAGLLIPKDKSRCSQVPAIEMKVRGWGGYGPTEKNVNGLTNYFPMLVNKMNWTYGPVDCV